MAQSYSDTLTVMLQKPSPELIAWLQTERATGNLPVEIALDCIVELLSRHIVSGVRSNATPQETGEIIRSLYTTVQVMRNELEVYKRAVKAMRADLYMGCNCSGCAEIYRALAAVDKLEGK